MNYDPTTQVSLFDSIKNDLPSYVSLVHDISELLELSYDSAYRRIRGKKELSLDELKKLSLHYNISIDSLFNLKSDNVVFNSLVIGEKGISFIDWLQNMLFEVKIISSFKEKEFIYSAKDIPIFNYLAFPEIFSFKIYFWHKTLIPTQGFERKFITLDLDDNLQDIGRQIANIYCKIPTRELWNEETFNSIIRQIEYCFVSGYFSKKEDALRLCDVLETMIYHLERQAELGFKFLHGTNPEGIEDSYKLYCNEVLLGDNTIFVKINGNTTTFLTFNVINLLKTSNPVFCNHIEHSLRNLMQKSSLISATSSKGRNCFFLKIFEKINTLRKKIE